MSTFSAILEPDAEGMLHLPVPAAWGKSPVRVKAEMEPVSVDDSQGSGAPKGFGALRGRISISPDFDLPLEDFKDYTV